jgi:hypothetical protein
MRRSRPRLLTTRGAARGRKTESKMSETQLTTIARLLERLETLKERL